MTALSDCPECGGSGQGPCHSEGSKTFVASCRTCEGKGQVCATCGRVAHRMRIFYALMHPCPAQCNNSTDAEEQTMLAREGWS